MIKTFTVNQWHIKHNAENPDAKLPVVCVNCYTGVEVERNTYGKVVGRTWGEQVGHTEHYYDIAVLGDDVQVIYDPMNKTPCGASCWMQAEY